ncbi:MAG: thiol-disulfide isomerase [Acidobacteria bacterium]|nr:MAG: thiol-disulfide isomerase [Acidobacteriota bacterium]
MYGLVAVGQGAPQYAKPTGAVDAPTFTKDVAPILYKSCTNCHRPGEIAPMSLLTFKDARPWAKSIRDKVSQGLMPPWHADPTHGEFVNDRRLSDADKDTILKWVAGGAPEGNPADLPPQPKYAEGWMMGHPDSVMAMTEEYPLPASGTVEYKYFEIPTNFAEDKYVQAIEVVPGNRAVVHHVIVFARAPLPPAPPPDVPRPQPQPAVFKFAPDMEQPKDPEREAKKKGPANDRPAPQRMGSFVGGFAPGQNMRLYEPGQAIKVPAGSVLVFQMHYTPNGTATADRTKVGFIFAKEPPKQEMKITALINANFTIPPGAPDQRVDAEMTIQRDITVWSMLPHTHVRGKRWEYQAIYPDGRTETILAVPKYDFNWQTEYIFKQPLKLPKGTKIHSTAWYDNSAANRSNPDPSSEVHWGDQTWEEMQFSGITYTVDLAPAAPTAEVKPGGGK